ncbi:helix-hairpin-helix domain-containing protein [Actinoplanes sp. NPDC051851]|uniref:helix-hairpin-helix domain-containing protein n=1 Tax=Actinoplanes sp. NPDC051851 TaxID=3154753 RepID=UPI0034315764
MAWFIGQSLVIVLLSFALGVIVGRLSVRRSKPVLETVTETPSAETPAKPDELERIEGIGPKMASALRSAGIHTFAQLAESTDDAKRAAIRAAGLSFAPSLVTWSRQAQLLADGEEAAFLELTERLIAGRDTSTPTPSPAVPPTTKPTKPSPTAPPSTEAAAPATEAAAPAAARDAEVAR